MINWDKLRKQYPDTIQEIQDWFCVVTSTKTKIWFYKQPVWRNEIFPVFLAKQKNIRIGFDVKWNEKDMNFAFIYAIVDGDQMIPPTAHYQERSIAEIMSYVHALQYIEDKKKKEKTELIHEEIINEDGSLTITDKTG